MVSVRGDDVDASSTPVKFVRASSRDLGDQLLAPRRIRIRMAP
jgi:hypothetical protein